MLLLIKGIVLGFSIAAPVGPIGMLCIRRTLISGMGNGIMSGLGAATADALYGSIAVLGVSVVSAFLLGHQFCLQLIGGIFLLYLGYTTCQSKPAKTAGHASDKGLLRSYASTLLLTLTNPMTILSFAGIFAGLGAGAAAGDYLSSFTLVLGVFIGSMLWWTILSGITSILRHKFDPKRLKWVNQLSGLVIVGFGLFVLMSV